MSLRDNEPIQGYEVYDGPVAAHENVNKGQFRIQTGPNETQIDYVRPHEVPPQHPGQSTHVSELMMMVYHRPDRTAYDYADHDNVPWTDFNSIHTGPSPEPSDPDPGSPGMRMARRDRLSPDDANQPTLFGMHTDPGVSKVDFLVGTKRGRIHAGTMLGIAQNRNITERGRSLVASDDLSPHSHRMVNKLASAGATDPTEHEDPNNSMTFREAPYSYHYMDDSEAISPSEARGGRNTIRRALKGGDPDPRGRATPNNADKAKAKSAKKRAAPGRYDPNQGSLF